MEKNFKVIYSNYIPAYFTGIAIYNDNSRGYYLNGKLHREDGPAEIYYIRGKKNVRYFIKGMEYSKKDYLKKIMKNKKKFVALLFNLDEI